MPLLSVIVPVFNEEATVAEVLRRVLAAAYDKQVIVVDDGSTDGTARAIAECGIRNAEWFECGVRNSECGIKEGTSRSTDLVLLRHDANLGKGAAIRSGLRAATGEFTIIQDADLEYDPGDYARLIEPLRAGAADVVYGSRYKGSAVFFAGAPTTDDALESSAGDGRPTPAKKSAGPVRLTFRSGVALLNWAVRLLYGVRLTDEATCYKAFRTADLLRMDLKCRGFEFCPEVTAKACRMGFSILEVPIRYSPRGRKEGKKIRWRDGLAAIRELWRWRNWRPSGEKRVGIGTHSRGSRSAVPADP